MNRSSKLASVVAQCWSSQLVLLIGLLCLSLTQSAIKDDFTEFLYDPGEGGFRLFCALTPLYALMPVLVRICDRVWFRWLNCQLLFMTILLPAGHQTKHFLQGKPVDQWLVSLDVVAALIAVVGGVAAASWARSVPTRRG